MSVDIEPLELNFKRPFTVEVEQTLTIKNAGSSPLAFKVKTTAPRQYCVRPNAGRIEPGSSFNVTVLLQAMKADPPLDSKCRDKFLVQSAAIPGDKDFDNITAIFDSTDKSQLQERKIRVNWLAANGESGAGASPAAAAVMTPSKQRVTNGDADTPDISRTYSSPSAAAPPPYNEDSPAKEETSNEPQSMPAKAAAAVASTAEVGYEELKNKLALAQGELAKLKDSSLRQRNVKGSEGGEKKPVEQAAQAVKQQSAEGVSVQVVAILCLLSFLLAYFFF